MDRTERHDSTAWQEKAVEYARILSQVKWTPVADGMPSRRGGCFAKGTEYTGVPYSSVRSAGRYIGFDVFLKTFLAAVQNPRSVLYTENLAGKVDNAATYYGTVCSSYVSYALQCGIWYVSRLYGPSYREGVRVVTPPSAPTVEVGDVIYTPPCPGSHVEIVTAVSRSGDGTVTQVRIEESAPPTTRTTTRSAADFDSHLAANGRTRYRITDLDAWRADNRAESFLFPNYAVDAATPLINRVLLLDRGDWVPYQRNQAVRFNVMDRDSQGVRTLVIRRGNTVAEEISVRQPGVIERSFSTCDDYTAQGVLADGSLSQACEFSVCDLDFGVSGEAIPLGKPWEIAFTSDNMDVIIVYLWSDQDACGRYTVPVTGQDRRNGRLVIPAGLIRTPGNWQVWLIGENRYGRLKQRRDITVIE